MKVEANSREEYFATSGERELELRELDAFIQKHAPHLKPVLAGGSGMTGSMLGYGMMPYKTKSSKKVAGEWPLIALMTHKNYVSLYICAVIDGGYVAEKYSAELGKVSVGRSCVRFKKLSDLNLDTVREILVDLDQRFARGEKLFGA